MALCKKRVAGRVGCHARVRKRRVCVRAVPACVLIWATYPSRSRQRTPPFSQLFSKCNITYSLAYLPPRLLRRYAQSCFGEQLANSRRKSGDSDEIRIGGSTSSFWKPRLSGILGHKDWLWQSCKKLVARGVGRVRNRRICVMAVPNAQP